VCLRNKCRDIEGQDKRIWAHNVVPLGTQTSTPWLTMFSYGASGKPRHALLGFLYSAYEVPEPRLLSSQTLPGKAHTCLLGIFHTVRIRGSKPLKAACWDLTDGVIRGPDRRTCNSHTVPLGGPDWLFFPYSAYRGVPNCVLGLSRQCHLKPRPAHLKLVNCATGRPRPAVKGCPIQCLKVHNKK